METPERISLGWLCVIPPRDVNEQIIIEFSFRKIMDGFERGGLVIPILPKRALREILHGKLTSGSLYY